MSYNVATGFLDIQRELRLPRRSYANAVVNLFKLSFFFTQIHVKSKDRNLCWVWSSYMLFLSKVPNKKDRQLTVHI